MRSEFSRSALVGDVSLARERSRFRKSRAALGYGTGLSSDVKRRRRHRSPWLLHKQIGEAAPTAGPDFRHDVLLECRHAIPSTPTVKMMWREILKIDAIQSGPAVVYMSKEFDRIQCESRDGLRVAARERI
jgi:hypothetical protein